MITHFDQLDELRVYGQLSDKVVAAIFNDSFVMCIGDIILPYKFASVVILWYMANKITYIHQFTSDDLDELIQLNPNYSELSSEILIPAKLQHLCRKIKAHLGNDKACVSKQLIAAYSDFIADPY